MNWTPNLHPRYPKGHPKGGKFMKKGSADWAAAVKKQQVEHARATGAPAPKAGAPTKTPVQVKLDPKKVAKSMAVVAKKAAPAKAAKATKAAKKAAPTKAVGGVTVKAGKPSGVPIPTSTVKASRKVTTADDVRSLVLAGRTSSDATPNIDAQVAHLSDEQLRGLQRQLGSKLYDRGVSKALGQTLARRKKAPSERPKVGERIPGDQFAAKLMPGDMVELENYRGRKTRPDRVEEVRPDGKIKTKAGHVWGPDDTAILVSHAPGTAPAPVKRTPKKKAAPTPIAPDPGQSDALNSIRDTAMLGRDGSPVARAAAMDAATAGMTDQELQTHLAELKSKKQLYDGAVAKALEASIARRTPHPFDPSKASVYKPTTLNKVATAQPGPAAGQTETIDVPQWGEGAQQHFTGPWMKVQEDSGSYGVAMGEWNTNNEPNPDVPGGWRKKPGASVDAYRHSGDPVRVSTTLADGTSEVSSDGQVGRLAGDGDWVVKQPGGELMVVSDEEFRKRYDTGSASAPSGGAAPDWAQQLSEAIAGGKPVTVTVG